MRVYLFVVALLVDVAAAAAAAAAAIAVVAGAEGGCCFDSLWVGAGWDGRNGRAGEREGEAQTGLIIEQGVWVRRLLQMRERKESSVLWMRMRMGRWRREKEAAAHPAPAAAAGWPATTPLARGNERQAIDRGHITAAATERVAKRGRALSGSSSSMACIHTVSTMLHCRAPLPALPHRPSRETHSTRALG